VLQGMLGGLLLLCMFNAIKHVPLANSSAIMFCTPVFTFVLAPCMLREQCGIYRYTFTLCFVMINNIDTKSQ
jgi:drug/metabolite transporter (DMT)-like permease